MTFMARRARSGSGVRNLQDRYFHCKKDRPLWIASREIMSTFTRYFLFQLPGWALIALVLYFLAGRTALPLWAAILLFGLWCLKDLVMYPWVRSAYEKNGKSGVEGLIGKKGVAHEVLQPDGYIKIRGELWQARSQPPDRINKESIVKVTGARGMTLFVQADDAKRR
jgi:membrane protein implicated in regulation of membrane protease activity